MYRLPALGRAAVLAPLFLLLSCSRDLPVLPSESPKFNHVPDPMGIVVDVNNIWLQLNPDGLGLGARLGHPFLFAGGVAYGTSGSSVVWWDTRNSTSGLLAVSGLRVSQPGLVADHQTVSLLANRHWEPNAPNVPPRLFLIQETFAFSADPDRNYVIVKYTLYNPGQVTVSGLYAGQVLDLDVGNDQSQNYMAFSGSFVEQWMSPQDFRAGHVLLGNDPLTSFRVWRNGAGSGLPADPPWTMMFDYLSGGVGPTGTFGPGDLRNLLGIGPVSIGPGASHAFAFALLANENTAELDGDISAAHDRGDDLSSSPYPVAPVSVTIVPDTLNLATQGVMKAQLTFASATVTGHFDPAAARCAGALPVRVQVQRERVALTFNRADLDPNAIIVGRVVCGGFLTDGTAWIGDDTVTIGNNVPGFVSATVTQLTSDPATNDFHAEWSPDGHSITFDRNQNGVPDALPDIYRMDVEAGEASLVLLASQGYWPDWSPDGGTIAFSGTDPDGGGMWAVPATGGSPVRLVDEGGGQPAWSPDGSAIAFIRMNGTELWVMEALGEFNGGAADPVTTTGFSNTQPHWGQDGLLYFQARGRPDDTIAAVFRADPAVGEGSVARVTPIEGVPNFCPAVSPDGKTLAFGSAVPYMGRELVLQNLETGEHIVVRDGPNPLRVQDRVEWSPDGRRILFSWNGDIYVADLGKVNWSGHP